MWGRATLATLVSSTSMKVASMTTMAMSHGFTTRCGALDCMVRLYLVKMVASTFMPGRRTTLWASPGSSLIFTGMR